MSPDNLPTRISNPALERNRRLHVARVRRFPRARESPGRLKRGHRRLVEPPRRGSRQRQVPVHARVGTRRVAARRASSPRRNPRATAAASRDPAARHPTHPADACDDALAADLARESTCGRAMTRREGEEATRGGTIVGCARRSLAIRLRRVETTRIVDGSTSSSEHPVDASSVPNPPH